MRCLISKEIEFDYGHRVPNHDSKCKNLHGHRGKVRAVLSGNIIEEEGTSSEGMLMDFSKVKEILMENIHDYLDHRFIMYKNDKLLPILLETGCELVIVDFIPTAENIAKHSFEKVAPIIKMAYGDELRLVSIEFWETPTSKAIWGESES